MDVTPVATVSKRSRVKGAPKAAATTKPARKAPTTARKNAPATQTLAAPALAPDLTAAIAQAAFFLAAQRNFAPGRELDDWLEAERRIRAAHAG